MRTTITINDDLMSQLKKRSYETGKSLKDVINSTLRIGLKLSNKSPRKYSCPEFALGKPSHYNLDRALDLVESLENEEVVRKIQLKK